MISVEKEKEEKKWMNPSIFKKSSIGKEKESGAKFAGGWKEGKNRLFFSLFVTVLRLVGGEKKKKTWICEGKEKRKEEGGRKFPFFTFFQRRGKSRRKKGEGKKKKKAPS